MTLWVCTACATSYSVDAPCCPHCTSTSQVEEGQEMPKLTRHGGATDTNAPEAPQTPVELIEDPPTLEPVVVEPEPPTPTVTTRKGRIRTES